MECNKWQEEGLLYVSREMDASQAEEYEKHVQICDVCRIEIDQYIHDKKTLFSADMLCESPSEHIDKKIIAACSSMPKSFTEASRSFPQSGSRGRSFQWYFLFSAWARGFILR